MTTNDDFDELDADQLNQMSRADREILEKANRTITNLLRREPLRYFEVAQNALISTLEGEKIELDGRNRDLLDKLDAIRDAVKACKHGDAVETLLLVSKIETILGEDI